MNYKKTMVTLHGGPADGEHIEVVKYGPTLTTRLTVPISDTEHGMYQAEYSLSGEAAYQFVRAYKMVPVFKENSGAVKIGDYVAYEERDIDCYKEVPVTNCTHIHWRERELEQLFKDAMNRQKGDGAEQIKGITNETK